MTKLPLLLVIVPAMALAQAAGAPATAPPPPTLNPQQTTAELARLHSQMDELKTQLGDAKDAVQSLDQKLTASEERSNAFQEQVSQLQDRGSSNEEARVGRIQTLDGVTNDSLDLNYLMTLGADNLDAPLAQLQQKLEQVHESAGATSGRLEYERDAAALQSIAAARQALADGDYFSARGYLTDMLTYEQAAQAAAAANPMREWSGQ